jgi:glycosyltransferase involved in cell wall biosynthesis
MYPIAHHDWMTHHLNLEAQHNPSWAPHLQGHDISVGRKKLLDDEIRLADLIVVPSSFARESFIESGVDARKVVAVGLGADLTESALVADETRDTVLPKKLKVLFAGQINQRKGLSYALGAIEALKDEATLTAVGPIQPQLRDQLRRDYPHVEILPPRSRTDLLRLMRDSDVLLFPSLAEGFGLVGIESMSVGTPVILTNRTFANDVVTDGVDGWLVPACSSDPIVHVLRTLIDDRSILVQTSENARLTANKWDWSRFESTFLSVINEILSGA